MVEQLDRSKDSSEPTENVFAGARDRARLLTDLANLHDEGQARYRAWNRGLRQKLFAPVSDAELLNLRNQLRSIWDRETPAREKNEILTTWLNSVATGQTSPFKVRFEYRRILPASHDLRQELAFAVLEQARRLAVCHNEDCPARYFLARRKTQKYCERGDCSAHAQRQYALNWWRRQRQRKSSKQARARKEKQ